MKKTKTKIHIVPPNIVALDGRYGDQHEIEEVVLEMQRDINIFFDRKETGEHVAIIPVKVTYRRKIL